MSTLTIDNQGVLRVAYPGQPNESHIIQATSGGKWTLLANGTTGAATFTDGASGLAESVILYDQNGIPWTLLVNDQGVGSVEGFEKIIVFAPVVNAPIVMNGLPAYQYHLGAYNQTTGLPETIYTKSETITQQANPALLDRFGMPELPIFIEVGKAYEFRLYLPGGGEAVRIWKQIVGGVASGVVNPAEWNVPDISCRYLSSSSVIVEGDARSNFIPARRVRITGTAITTATIREVSFSGSETIIICDVTGGDPPIDQSALLITYGMLSPESSAIPARYHVGYSTVFQGSVTVDKKNGVNLLPVASIMLHLSPLPDGWLQCNGANVSRTTYALLFAAIGTTFGAGDGSTSFGLPNIAAVGSFLYCIYAQG